MANEFRKVTDQNGVDHPVTDQLAQNGVIANTKLIKDTVGWSAKQKIPFPYADGYSKSNNGVTWSVDADGVVTADTGGGSSTDSYFTLVSQSNELLVKAGKYILTGGHTPDKIVFVYDGSSFYTDYGEGRLIEFDSDTYVQISVRLKSGQTANNEKFYPMLRDASILDDTYEPYFGSTAVDWSSYAKTGVHNLIPINSFTGGTGITATINEDKSVSLTAGTVTSELVCPATINAFNLANTPFGVGDKLTFTIGNNKKQSSIELQVLYKVTSADSWTTLVDQSNVDSVSFTVPQCEILLVRFRVLGAVTATTLYPMLIFTANTDPTYAPYAMTNKELTEKKLDDVVSTLTSSHNLNDIKKVGFYRIGDSTPTNSPISNLTYCCLEVLYSGINQGLIQRITGADGNMWFRTHAMGSDVWNSWYKVTTTVVS